MPAIIVVDVLQEFDCVSRGKTRIAYECQDENEGQHCEESISHCEILLRLFPVKAQRHFLIRPIFSSIRIVDSVTIVFTEI